MMLHQTELSGQMQQQNVYFNKKLGKSITRKHRSLKPIGAPKYVQAQNIINILGGPFACAEALGYPLADIYRWTKPLPKGTDGLIPHGRIGHVMRVCRHWGVIIPPEAWCPYPAPKELAGEKIPSVTAGDIIHLLYGEQQDEY